MYMSVIDEDTGSAIYPELAGLRVLITGLSPEIGVDLARAFADHGCRLVLQADNGGPEVDAIGEILSPSAGEIRLFTEPLRTGEEAVRFAQTSAQSLGGLEAVVNLVKFSAADLAAGTTMDELEDMVSRKLLPMTLMTRVVANRMRLTLTEGLILNVVVMPGQSGATEAAAAMLVRAAVAALTRGEAQAWAGEALRINAIAPCGLSSAAGECLESEPEIAALAVHLASPRGCKLSGLVFDAGSAAH